MTAKRLIGRYVVSSTKDSFSDILSSDEFDFSAMHERACLAIYRLGRTQREIANLMGIDVNIPIHERKNVKPTMENIVKMAGILGVSVQWLLTGKPESHVDFFVLGSDKANHAHAAIGEAQKSAVVQGNKDSTIIVKNLIGSDLNEQENELIRLFRIMDVRQRAEFLISAYDVNKGA